MKTNATAILLTTGILLSCGDEKKESSKIRSFELSPINGKDTINVIDSKGRKQGVWLKIDPANNSVSVTDALFYKNDSLVKK